MERPRCGFGTLESSNGVLHCAWNDDGPEVDRPGKFFRKDGGVVSFENLKVNRLSLLRAKKVSIVWPDGSTYKGDVSKQWSRHGQGVMIQADGTKLVCNWLNDSCFGNVNII